ncbi:MAG: EAL domain-containing protein [Aestuariivirga sp.]|nr:EAL domain-containing protein [Aestuariivirga sp.]
MPKSLRKPGAEAPQKNSLETLAKLHADSRDFLEREQQETIAELKAQALRYETVIDKISQGVCFFDSDKRLILGNRRYAEIYGLKIEDVSPGTSLREISERRTRVGTCPMAVEDYLAWGDMVNSTPESKNMTVELQDGRTIHIFHQPMPDGGWVATHEDITELKTKRAMANERISLQTLIDTLPDSLWVKDANSRFIIANKATASDNDLAGPGELIGKNDFDLHAPELAQHFYDIEQEIMHSGQAVIDMEEDLLDASGRIFRSTTKLPVRNEQNEVFGLIGISRDITGRKRADTLRNGQAQILEMIALSAELGEVLDHLMRLVESQLDGIFGSVLLLDQDGHHLRHGAAPSLAESYTKAIDGMRIGPKAGSCGTAVFRRAPVIVADIMSDPLWEDFRELVAAHGYRSCWSTPILSHQGTVLGVFAMYSLSVREPTAIETQLIEMTTRIAGIAIERKHSEDQIRFLAHHDALTGLPNRSLLKDRLTQAILQTQRYNPWVSVVFIDLDNFKMINDSLGHTAGDELLKAVAQRMVGCIRAIDTVVRLGGDEFVILLVDQPARPDEISETLERIRTAIAEPVSIDGRALYVTCSIGVATFPNDGPDPETLLMNADAAMYKAKEAGRDNVQFYTAEMNTRVHEKLALQQEMRDALARSEFVLHYQPQVDLRTGGVFAVEALVRWRHPNLGLLSPLKFIPMAEETGLIVPLGDWVLHDACRQNKAWQDAGLPPVNVCVNVSARQFREKNLVSRVVSALRESGLAAKYLELEITESLIMQDVDQAVATMKELQRLGVQLAIDDFGTGYSSLNALKTFPVARLKIDKSFINNLASDDSDKAVAAAVISLGQKLNLRVIAEGVETIEQVAILRDNNCDECQGYYFSKPVSFEAIADLLKKQALSLL